MSDLTARLDLPLIKPSQAQKHVTHNEALQVLDGLVQAVLEEVDATAPPFEPVTGQLFALAPGATGDWADQGGKLALRAAGGWVFITPEEGWRAWDRAEGKFKVYQGGAWSEIAADLDNLDGVGIGTTSDSINRLAVFSDATLLSHAGAGHQVKVNKAGSSDTASLLFQSGWTGHAEMGLAGDTAFSIKISSDGASWVDALRADPAAAELTIDLPITGNAVQQGQSDTTDGRLLGVGAFGLGAIVPTVSSGDDYNDSYGRRTTFIGHPSSSNAPSNNPVASNRGALGFQAFSATTARGMQFVVQCQPDASGRNGRAFVRGYDTSWTDWYELYGQHSVLGTVSEVGGVPTGALIERGSNANGDYVRFADGTQICVFRAPAPVSVAQNAVLDLTWTYPAAFAPGTANDVALDFTPERETSANGTVPAICHAAYRDSMTTTQAALGVTNLNTVSDFGYVLKAVGRWF